MLALRFQLTPAQTGLLIDFAAGNYCREERGPILYPPQIESPFFIATVNALVKKGLVDHDNARNPTFLITDQGRAMAQLIYAAAKDICARIESPQPVKPAPHPRKTPAL